MSQFFSPASPQQRSAEAFIDWNKLLADAAAKHAGWSVPEAYFGILYAAATCDGEVAAEEQEAIGALIHRSRALKALQPAELARLNAQVSERFAADRDKALMEACAALPQDMRLATFAHALDIAVCDGELRTPEASLLNALVAHMQLERAAVERVAEVILMKNKY